MVVAIQSFLVPMSPKSHRAHCTTLYLARKLTPSPPPPPHSPPQQKINTREGVKGGWWGWWGWWGWVDGVSNLLKNIWFHCHKNIICQGNMFVGVFLEIQAPRGGCRRRDPGFNHLELNFCFASLLENVSIENRSLCSRGRGQRGKDLIANKKKRRSTNT